MEMPFFHLSGYQFIVGISSASIKWQFLVLIIII